MVKRRTFLQKSSAAAIGLGILPFGCNSNEVDTETIIMGGGLSGLYLAHLLDKAGKEYILLEGSERLGGRMFNRKDIDREVGGRGIGDKYTEVMSLIETFDIEMIDITDFARSPSAIYINDQWYDKWPNSKTNPAYLQFTAFAKSQQLGALDQWYQQPDLDETYSELLMRNGLTEAEIDIVNVSANYNDVRSTSSMNAYHSAAFRKFNGSKRLLNFKQGTNVFIEAIAKSLTQLVLTQKMAISISDNNQHVMVKCADGSSYRAKKLVSTLPFTTLRDVKMNCSFNINQGKAIKQLDYTNITQIHLAHSEPFWEEDGLPLDMWTHTPLERIMNVSANKEDHQIACWVNGAATRFFDNMTDKEIGDFTIKELNKIRPSTQGKISYLGTQNWGKYPYNKGAYVEFAVGQPAWFLDMIKPAGNMHFAGEHTAHKSRGMEGAAESAKRVFNELNAIL